VSDSEDDESLEVDNVDRATLDEVRDTYPTLEAVRVSIQQLDPTYKYSGNYATASKRLAKLINDFRTSPAAPLKAMTSVSNNGAPETIGFYKSTFNFIDRIDRFAAMLVWATRVQNWNVLLLIYVIRLAIVNLHAVKGELQTMEDTPGNPRSTSSSDEFEDSAEQLNRMRDTLNELKTALFAFEEQFLTRSMPESNQTTTSMSAASSTTSSPPPNPRKRQRTK
jgi:methyl-accepting chemotaxis protein